MRTVRIVSRDGALSARLRRLLGGSLDLGAGDTLAEALQPNAAGHPDVVLVDLGSADVDPDQLAAAASGGDVEAVGRLYDILVLPIYRYVAVRVHRREDAEDLTQLVFERIVSSLPRYRSRGRPFRRAC